MKKSLKTSVNLFDHVSKLYILIKKSQDKVNWERYVSSDKEKWILTHSCLNLEDALRFKEEVINNNYRNLFSLISKK